MRNPASYAHWVRQVHDMERDAPLDVDSLAERCGIEVYEDEFDGFLGLWINIRDQHGIALDSRQIPTRRRFTLAHELGHASIPRHAKARSLKCLAADLSGADSDKATEREANEFAAELLAPGRLVTPMLQTGSMSLAKAQEIAERFDISLTAGARRVVEWCGEAAAVVLCEEGEILWSVRRNGFPYGLPARGSPIPPATMADHAWSANQGSLEPQEIESFRWLPEAHDARSVRVSMLESAIRLGETGQVLSLLWLPDLD